MSEEKCCCCIPIEIGAKLLGGFCILATAMCVLTFWFSKEFYELFWPIIIFYGLMSSMWIYAFADPSYKSREIAFWTFVVLIWTGVAVYETYLLCAGKLGDYLCSPETVEQLGEALDQTTPYTAEQCKADMKIKLIIDVATTWISNTYFAWVIWRWMKNFEKLEEEYEKN